MASSTSCVWCVSKRLQRGADKCSSSARPCASPTIVPSCMDSVFHMLPSPVCGHHINTVGVLHLHGVLPGTAAHFLSYAVHPAATVWPPFLPRIHTAFQRITDFPPYWLPQSWSKPVIGGHSLIPCIHQKKQLVPYVFFSAFSLCIKNSTVRRRTAPPADLSRRTGNRDFCRLPIHPYSRKYSWMVLPEEDERGF